MQIHCRSISLMSGLATLLLAVTTPYHASAFSAPLPGSTANYLERLGEISTGGAISEKTEQDDTNDSSETTIPMNTPARQSLPDHLRLEAMPGKGLGVITNTFIPKGTVVGDYKGEVLTAEVKDRRYLESQKQPIIDDEWRQSRLDKGQTLTGTYLYGVVFPNGSHVYVDAEDEYCSLWTRFLNHASGSAANVNPKSLHADMDGNPRVWFVSLRDIEVGEELCFDYGDDYWLPEDNVV